MLNFKILKKPTAVFPLVCAFRINANKYPSVVAFRQTKKEENEYRKEELTVECGYQETGKEYNVISMLCLSVGLEINFDFATD